MVTTLVIRYEGILKLLDAELSQFASLRFEMFRHPPWAVGSYSSGTSAGGTLQTQVNLTLLSEHQNHPVQTSMFIGESMNPAKAVQGDPSVWLKPPVDLYLECSVTLFGSYSSGPPHAGAVGTKSTGGFSHPDGSPCNLNPLPGTRTCTLGPRRA